MKANRVKLLIISFNVEFQDSSVCPPTFGEREDSRCERERDGNARINNRG